MTTKSNLLSFLWEDDQYKEFNNFFNRIKNSISVSSIELEINQKIEKRGQLKVINMAITDDYTELKNIIISSSLENQILRSRLTHLKVEVYKNQKKLDDYQESIQRYLFVTYKDDLEKLGYKTQADKGYIIGCLFIDFTRFINDLKALDQTIEFLIKDIDQQSWTLKNIISMLEIVFKNNKIL